LAFGFSPIWPNGSTTGAAIRMISQAAPEAIRRLVEIGLTVRAKEKQTTAATADRAKELASKAIDSLTAGAPNNDEKASRKRRLIKGPEEFREVRVDRPKAKGKS
jgi:hypothetical protein